MANCNLNHQFLLSHVATFKWHDVGGRTVAKMLQFDLPVVTSIAPDIVILQLGTNDLSRLDPLVVGSSIKELVTILHDTYNVKLICVCQTLLGSDPVFNTRVRAFNKYVQTFLKALPYVFFWDIEAFGMHLRDSIGRGNISFFGASEGPF